MIDFSLFFCFIGICFIVLIVVIAIRFFQSLVTVGQSTIRYNEETDNQIKENSREDSQADLYMTEEPEDYDNLMFPEE